MTLADAARQTQWECMIVQQNQDILSKWVSNRFTCLKIKNSSLTKEIILIILYNNHVRTQFLIFVSPKPLKLVTKKLRTMYVCMFFSWSGPLSWTLGNFLYTLFFFFFRKVVADLLEFDIYIPCTIWYWSCIIMRIWIYQIHLQSLQVSNYGREWYQDGWPCGNWLYCLWEL